MPKDPSECGIQCDSDQWNVVAAEAGGLFPEIAIAEEACDGDRVPQSIACAFSPDSHFDQSTAD